MSNLVRLERPAPSDWRACPTDIVLGIDIVELVSSAMYVDPLATYREYIQNAADAVDDARVAGVLRADEAGRVDIAIDSNLRTVRIRDNGTGITGDQFLPRLTAFGASTKRGRHRRGFRGVGRLAGLGYCQELVFRSRARAGEPILELRWDCRELRALLRSNDYAGTLGDAVSRCTGHRSLPTAADAGYPPHFFEVELRGVVRHGKDALLDEVQVGAYLGQVAPITFSGSFSYTKEIEGFIGESASGPGIEIFVNGQGPLERPYADVIWMRDGLASKGGELSLITIPSVDGQLAAKAWILHHDYVGAIPRQLGVRGLRVRCGDIQIGGESVLDDVFVEPRFNVWAVGEVHIFDRRVVPNGRRDQFEQNIHWANVVNHLSPVGRDIASRCRARSHYRQLVRKADYLVERLNGGFAVLRQGALTVPARHALLASLETSFQRLLRLSESRTFSEHERQTLRRQCARLRARLDKMATAKRRAAPLRGMTPKRRRNFEEAFSLIYECSSDERHAKDLIDRILKRL